MNAAKMAVAAGMAAVLLAAGAGMAGIIIETVPVGNIGNIADSTGYGAVAYEYNIGKYEVTASQYAEFLNAVASDDKYGLYNPRMFQVGTGGCQIARSGSAGNYTYSAGPEWASRPVNTVSWGDAARFANWLHNGQPTGEQDMGTTEDGAYYLDGAMTHAELLAVTREADWQWAITSEDEWYKAAYHMNDGNTGLYFDYPTSSDTAPSNVLGQPWDAGNSATFYDGDYTSPYRRTIVGAHENSAGPYGTFDQGGNVQEWNEGTVSGVSRGFRGGEYAGSSNDLLRTSRTGNLPAFELSNVGFRVVSPHIPEPATAAVLILGGIGVLLRRRAIRR